MNPSEASSRDAPAPAIFSTLVDATPKYELQGLLCVWSLLRAGVPAEGAVIHHTPGLSREFRAAMRDLAVETREVPAHPSGVGVCNKVQQLRYGEWPRGSTIVLSDTDLVWLDPHLLPRVRFAAKIVGRPRPPEDRWQLILQEAGLSVEMVPVEIPLSPRERTPSTNLNGGLYILEASLAEDLGEAWDERVTWLMERRALIDWWTAGAPPWPQWRAVDQVAMALALLDLQVAPVYLDRGWNFPTHLKPELLSQPVVHIRALHHHDRLDGAGRLFAVGVDWIDSAIARANEVVDSMRSRCAEYSALLNASLEARSTS